MLLGTLVTLSITSPGAENLDLYTNTHGEITNRSLFAPTLRKEMGIISMKIEEGSFGWP